MAIEILKGKLFFDNVTLLEIFTLRKTFQW